MKKYKIVASDLDGTLLNNRSQISSENLAAIDGLLEKGVYFVPSSGRSLTEIPAEIRDNPAIRYIIYSNGAVVWDRQTGPCITNCISNSLMREILNTLTAYETHITIRQNGRCIVDSAFQRKQDYEYYNVCQAHQNCIKNFAVQMDDFTQYAYNADNVEVIAVFFNSYTDKMNCKKQLEQTGKLHIVEGDRYNIEILSIDAGKGKALNGLADMLGVGREETISIGDSDNDYSSIKAAGLGLAVSNACDSLKQAADQVICSNEQHAIEYILSHFFCETT